jgi:hypothetical protein
VVALRPLARVQRALPNVPLKRGTTGRSATSSTMWLCASAHASTAKKCERPHSIRAKVGPDRANLSPNTENVPGNPANISANRENFFAVPAKIPKNVKAIPRTLRTFLQNVKGFPEALKRFVPTLKTFTEIRPAFFQTLKTFS